MKKSVLLAAFLALALSLAACQGPNPTITGASTTGPATTKKAEVTTTAPTTAADTSSTQGTEAPNADVYPLTAFSYIYEDAAGYQIEITLEIGAWVKGADSQLISQAWGIVGGPGDAPKYEDMFKSSSPSSQAESVFAFGTIYLENKTPGFSFTNENPKDCQIRLWLKSDHVPSMIIDYSGSRKLYTGGGNFAAGTMQPPTAKMVGDTWGPVPFAISLPMVITPKYPDGDPQIEDSEFIFGDCTFTLSKAW